MESSKPHVQGSYAFVCAIVLILSATSIRATTHVVNFGGSLGNTYSPSSFSASVGDTVQWVGSFSVHPLSSTTIPANAATWHVAAGNSFSYRIAVAGQFNYKCDVHPGMIGSFTVSATRVIGHVDEQILDCAGNATIILYDFKGRRVWKGYAATQGASALAPPSDRILPRGMVLVSIGPFSTSRPRIQAILQP